MYLGPLSPNQRKVHQGAPITAVTDGQTTRFIFMKKEVKSNFLKNSSVIVEIFNLLTTIEKKLQYSKKNQGKILKSDVKQKMLMSTFNKKNAATLQHVFNFHSRCLSGDVDLPSGEAQFTLYLLPLYEKFLSCLI